nr:hypothetical protein [uncultured bacterium]
MLHSVRAVLVPVLAAALAASTLAAPAAAGGRTGDAPLRLSGATPFPDCPPEAWPYGTVTPNTETEPWVAVNPTDPRHIVVAWQQDRWTTGSSRGMVVALTRDNGKTWKKVVPPGFTACLGGTFTRATDPWLSFGPRGELYLSATVGSATTNGVMVAKSVDGGETWATPVTLIADNLYQMFSDKQASTVDTRDPRYVYMVFNRRNLSTDEHELLFTRSTDAGATWEQPRAIHRPSPLGNGTVGNQIVVLPDGTLVNVFFESDHPIGAGPVSPQLPERIRVMRSADRGSTWSAPVTIAESELNKPVLPDDGSMVPMPGIVPDVAVDNRTGAVYVVWGEAGLSTSRSSVALSASYDGGRRWTPPKRVDRSPNSPAGGVGQAFLPQVDVADDGTVAVSYYDFRADTPAAGTPTTAWLITCRGSQCPASPGAWRERKLAGPFDLQRATQSFGGPFLGTYTGLAHTRTEFLAALVQTNDSAVDPQDVFLVRSAFC